MPDSVYEVIAQGARYWFLFLMTLIAWRSWRWYRKDKRQAKKRLKLLPDAGYVGEMVVIRGDEALEQGLVLAVPQEGTLGCLRTNDLCLPANGVARRHLWFRFDEDRGLMVEPFGKNAAKVDGEEFHSRRETLYMGHGSRLAVGAYELRLRLFAGFECTGYAQRQNVGEDEPASRSEAVRQEVDPDQAAAMQQWMMQQMWMQQQAAQQQAYEQGYRQAMEQRQSKEEADESLPEEDSLPYDVARIAQEEGMVDHSLFMRPPNTPRPELPRYEEAQPVETFYPPEMDGDEDWPDAPDPDAGVESYEYDEDATDAAMPPKSAYVGRDEAAGAKRRVWDRYFGGRA